jgi:methylmalonyl-CoA mutase cobalamin-binding subunit
MIYPRRPFFRRMLKSLIGCTILYAPIISSERSVVTCFGDVQIVYICSIRSSSAILVERFVRAPIYISGIR